jgi:hypothetical protein
MEDAPQINFDLKHTPCSENFYARNEMQTLIKENAEMRKFIFDVTGYYWVGVPEDEKKIDAKLIIKKLSQTQLCMNALTHCIGEYLTHLKKCSMPYMEAIYRKNEAEIKKHNESFIGNHVKSLMVFQKYVQEIIADTNLDPVVFEANLANGKYNDPMGYVINHTNSDTTKSSNETEKVDLKTMQSELNELCEGINVVHHNKYQVDFKKVV